MKNFKLVCMLLLLCLILPLAISCNNNSAKENDEGSNDSLKESTSDDNDSTDNSENPGEENTDSESKDDGNIDNEGGGMEVKKLDITVMSFNIRYLYSEDTGDRSWDSRKKPVSDFIMSKDASIVCLQEVMGTQYNNLKTLLVNRYDIVWYGRESINDTSGEGLAIAYDRNEWKLISKDRFWLSETPNEPTTGWGATARRIAVTAVLENRSTGARISVYNVHLDHKAVSARTNGIQLVLDRIAMSEYPVYLCGDFNSRREEMAYTNTATVMNDSQLLSPISNSGVSGNTCTSWGTSQRENDVIDFNFFTKRHFELVSFEICEDKWGENNDKYLSDHNAIISKVKMIYVS